MKTLRNVSFGLMCMAMTVMPSCEKIESDAYSKSQFENPDDLKFDEAPCDFGDCDPAPIVTTWTKAQYNAFGEAYKGSAKIDIAPGITLEKIKANDHELVFNGAAAGIITLAVKNGNVYQAYTFYTQCADNYTFDGKNVSGIKYGAFTPCDCPEEPECECIEEPDDSVISCTQAYYPTDDVEAIYHTGNIYRFAGYDYDANYPSTIMLQSSIGTSGGPPFIIRFYINFNLSDCYNTEKTLIENTSLYLYAHPTYEDHSSNKPNRHVFNRVISDWRETTVTWNNQPNVDETTSVITDHILGTLDEPRRDDYVFNLNDILLKNGKLRADYKGICCRPYQENINDYYRRVTFASRDCGNEALFPTLKVEYTFPSPRIKFENDVFSVTNNEDLEALFENVQYIWTINGEEQSGESVLFETTANCYTVHLQIIVTNNIGEVSEYNTSRAF